MAFQINQLVRTVLLFTCSIVVIGCVRTSGILPLGPDTYMLSVRMPPVLGGLMAAKTEAISQAQAYCTGMNKQFLAQSFNNTALSTIDINFLCLNSNDPGLQRPVLKPKADTSIDVNINNR